MAGCGNQVETGAIIIEAAPNLNCYDSELASQSRQNPECGSWHSEDVMTTAADHHEDVMIAAADHQPLEDQQSYTVANETFQQSSQKLQNTEDHLYTELQKKLHHTQWLFRCLAASVNLGRVSHLSPGNPFDVLAETGWAEDSESNTESAQFLPREITAAAPPRGQNEAILTAEMLCEQLEVHIEELSNCSLEEAATNWNPVLRPNFDEDREAARTPEAVYEGLESQLQHALHLADSMEALEQQLVMEELLRKPPGGKEWAEECKEEMCAHKIEEKTIDNVAPTLELQDVTRDEPEEMSVREFDETKTNGDVALNKPTLELQNEMRDHALTRSLNDWEGIVVTERIKDNNRNDREDIIVTERIKDNNRNVPAVSDTVLDNKQVVDQNGNRSQKSRKPRRQCSKHKHKLSRRKTGRTKGGDKVSASHI